MFRCTRSIFSGPTLRLNPSFLYIQTEICTEGTLKDWLLTRGEQTGLDLFNQVRFQYMCTLLSYPPLSPTPCLLFSVPHTLCLYSLSHTCCLLPPYVLFPSPPIIKQVLDAVVYIHEKGFVHRNLKPSNIFLFKNNLIKVGDFGFITNGEYWAHSDHYSGLQITDFSSHVQS